MTTTLDRAEVQNLRTISDVEQSGELEEENLLAKTTTEIVDEITTEVSRIHPIFQT